jgi:hypothetical protein
MVFLSAIAFTLALCQRSSSILTDLLTIAISSPPCCVCNDKIAKHVKHVKGVSGEKVTIRQQCVQFRDFLLHLSCAKLPLCPSAGFLSLALPGMMPPSA